MLPMPVVACEDLEELQRRSAIRYILDLSCVRNVAPVAGINLFNYRHLPADGMGTGLAL